MSHEKKTRLNLTARHLQEVKKQAATESLHEFIRQAWHVVEPTTRFVDGWHVHALCDHLEAMTRGDIRKLIINMPPRHMKSLSVGVFWFCWVWASRPSTRWLYSSYAHSLAVRDSMKCRQIIDSKWYQMNWGKKVKLRMDQNQKERFENTSAGFRIATGIDGKATGEGGDFIVTDDPHKAASARSDTQRQSVIDWWENTMSTRLNDPKTGCHLVCMQRLHENDLSGWLYEKERGYEMLCLPAEYESGHPVKTFTKIGWTDPRSEEGELLWPERFGQDELKELKLSLGTAYNVAGQLQQRPAPSDGGHFSRSFFQYFDEVEADGVQIFELVRSDGKKKRVLKSRCTCFQTCDTALKESDDSNFTVVMTFYVSPDGEIFVYHVSRDRIAVPKQYGFLIACRASNPDVLFQAVEEQQSGIGLIQEGRARGTPFRRMKAQGDKVQRTLQILTAYENGNVFHRSGAQASWLNDFEDEIQVFPNGRHDDQVDALAYGAKMAMAGAMLNVGPLVLNDMDSMVEVDVDDDAGSELSEKKDELAAWIAERESAEDDW